VHDCSGLIKVMWVPNFTFYFKCKVSFDGGLGLRREDDSLKKDFSKIIGYVWVTLS
jgi:hypothetical protein